MTTGEATLYELRYEGSADVERGPLGRFMDLAEQIRAEGLTVPPLVDAAIQQECAPLDQTVGRQ